MPFPELLRHRADAKQKHDCAGDVKSNLKKDRRQMRHRRIDDFRCKRQCQKCRHIRIVEQESPRSLQEGRLDRVSVVSEHRDQRNQIAR